MSHKYCITTTYFIWILLLVGTSSIAQDKAAFTRSKEFYIKGNTVVMGNNILGKTARKSFDKIDKVNDEFKMRYIDIDGDSDTWSSSSASFSIPEESKIVYASLYWSATYHGERSGERLNDNIIFYKKLEERIHNPQLIKLKVSNGVYHDVQGTLIYDGENAKSQTIKSKSPYAYQADVTQLLQGHNQGDVTVANVSATQGKMNGGSSAGWLLYIVYENENEPFQFITTYYGLESVKKEVVEIDFGNFRSSEDGELSTYVTIGALEGDSNLDKDQVRLYNPKSKLYLPFGNRVRSPNNFFNSSITLDNELVLNRKPSSKNTLGFDIAKVKIDDELNLLIANNPGGVKMQFKTRGDDYFLFFAAFQTTVSETFYKEEDKTQVEVTTTPTTQVPVEKTISETFYKEEDKTQVEVTTTPTTQVPVEKTIEEKIEIPNQINEEIVQTNETPIFSETLVKIINDTSVDVPGISGGFYIISNVFSNVENAKRWEQTLSRKDLSSNTFLRPDNNLYYVSLGNNTDPLIIYEVLKKIREDSDLAESWILKVNM